MTSASSLSINPIISTSRHLCPNERTFQILTQVAGRAGRENLPGKVIVQTYNPENFAIECSKEQNYDNFYKTEIELRKQLKYPPFCDIILIGFNSLVGKEIIEVSNKVYEYLKNLEASETQINTLIKKLESISYINDERYTESFVSEYIRKKM